EARRFTERGRTGVALRFGGFYCPDSEKSRVVRGEPRAGIAAIMGSADGWFQWIDADDAGAAVVAALGAPAGLYNVVDEPLRRREQREVLARAVGVRRVLAPPAATTRLGGEAGSLLARSQRVANRRFRDATGWAPPHPTVREGGPALAGAIGDGVRNAAGPIARLGLLLLSFPALQLGAS